MRATLAAAAGVLLLAPAGCGDEPGAAEPGQAPPVEAAPAGQVVPLPTGQAEGMVADPVTGLVAVGIRDPHGLVLVDGGTGEVVVETPLTERLRHLQLAAPGGPVLVPGEDSGEVIAVGLPGGEEEYRVAIGEWAHDATATPDGTVAVADEMGGAVVLVRDGQVVHRFTDQTQPGGVAAAGELVGAIDVHEHTLSLYDTGQDTVQPARVGRVDAGDGPTHIVADRRGRLLVTDTRGDRLLVFATTPELARVAELELPGSPYGIAYDPTRDRLWVTLTGRNELVGFDLTTDAPREVARIPTVHQPNTVAVDPQTGRIFVASRTEGTLQLVDQPS
jgi:DNA-binding beta-propeller fold protein YncE